MYIVLKKFKCEKYANLNAFMFMRIIQFHL